MENIFRDFKNVIVTFSEILTIGGKNAVTHQDEKKKNNNE